MKIKLRKWGNSLGVRIPKSIATELNLGDGSTVEVQKTKNQIVIEPVTEESLEELLSQVNDDNVPTETDFGKPEGKEVW